jgi:hypothetical protein
MLIVAGCVGLGFGALENIGYFQQHMASSAARFLTANFFHIVLTGLLGLAVCRAVKWPRQCLNHLPGVFLTVVLIHGLYNALISLPDLQDYQVFAMTAYILLSYQFFGETRALRPSGRDTISLTATFLFGISTLVAATYVFMSYDMAMTNAAKLLFPELLAVVVIVFMFLREIPQPVR